MSAKEWTLRYAEGYEDEDDEKEMDWLDEEEQREANAKKDPVSIKTYQRIVQTE